MPHRLYVTLLCIFLRVAIGEPLTEFASSPVVNDMDDETVGSSVLLAKFGTCNITCKSGLVDGFSKYNHIFTNHQMCRRMLRGHFIPDRVDVSVDRNNLTGYTSVTHQEIINKDSAHSVHEIIAHHEELLKGGHLFLTLKVASGNIAFPFVWGCDSPLIGIRFIGVSQNVKPKLCIHFDFESCKIKPTVLFQYENFIYCEYDLNDLSDKSQNIPQLSIVSINSDASPEYQNKYTFNGNPFFYFYGSTINGIYNIKETTTSGFHAENSDFLSTHLLYEESIDTIDMVKKRVHINSCSGDSGITVENAELYIKDSSISRLTIRAQRMNKTVIEDSVIGSISTGENAILESLEIVNCLITDYLDIAKFRRIDVNLSKFYSSTLIKNEGNTVSGQVIDMRFNYFDDEFGPSTRCTAFTNGTHIPLDKNYGILGKCAVNFFPYCLDEDCTSFSKNRLIRLCTMFFLQPFMFISIMLLLIMLVIAIVLLLKQNIRKNKKYENYKNMRSILSTYIPNENSIWDRPQTIVDIISNSDLHIIPIEKLSNMVFITNGAYGQVHRAIWNDQIIAMKSLKVEYLMIDEIEEFLNEIYLLSMLKHPNIIQIFGVSVLQVADPLDENVVHTSLGMVMPYMQRGCANS
eukprot:TRINITY_DN3134_c0_g1_i2.p1 TRINITY_DN3134_c0_g1~~TRINITY_DN3134_c0_g1_i2.p1  ORF type:complete len:633 (-),score=96.83 TRINITY_DN3134_c0_g1_i2:551-2449(-)